MQQTLFKFITIETKRQQIFLICLTLLSFPLLYALLNIPKIIINDALGGKHFPKEYSGFHLDQINYLFILSIIFFILVLLNGTLKFFMNYSQGKTTEFASYVLREQIFHDIIKFRLSHFQRYSSSELIHIMATEVEPIGNFVGESIALPFRQGGTLLTLLLFVFIQDIYMGLAAISLYPLQVYLVPIFQRKMNILTRKRSHAQHQFGEKIQEASEGIIDIKSYALQNRFTQIYDNEAKNLFEIKSNFFKEKYLLKFFNNIIGNIVPFLFYAIGGYFVIKGHLSLGALVSILAAHKDLQEPWIELLDYYQRLDDTKIRYENLKRKLNVPPESQIPTQPSIQNEPTDLSKTVLVGKNLYFSIMKGNPIVEAASFTLKPFEKTAIVSSSGEGKGVFTQLLAGLHYPDAGELYISNHTFLSEPEKLLGNEIHFVDREAYIFSGSIKENLLLPYAAAHEHREPSKEKIIEIIQKLNLQKDFEYIGLTKLFSNLTDSTKNEIIQLRQTFKKYIIEQYGDTMIDFYENKKFNQNLSLFENLTFGLAIHTYSIEEVEKYVKKLLRQVGLLDIFLKIGYDIAQTMFDMFADLSPNHPFLEEFSLIKAPELKDYKKIIENYPNIILEDQSKLLSLCFRFTPARHRVTNISESIQEKIVLFREEFKAFFNEEHPDEFLYYDEKEYNPLLPIWNNIIFGKMIYGLAAGQSKIDIIIQNILEKSTLKSCLLELALDYNVGLGGRNISRTQRQLIGIARAFLSPAQLIVLDKATIVLDVAHQRIILDYVLSKDFKKGVIWSVHESQMAKRFDTVLLFKDGRVLEQGNFKELLEFDGAFKKLYDQEQNLGVIHVA
ncbi:MAG: ABC transporter transmembrane domain-containing protein [Alphaproteobacteria bacterium]|nr:ABC transporter transmembrane domain-containing protein [Alphaproteobacteria bacterium]